MPGVIGSNPISSTSSFDFRIPLLLRTYLMGRCAESKESALSRVIFDNRIRWRELDPRKWEESS